MEAYRGEVFGALYRITARGDRGVGAAHSRRSKRSRRPQWRVPPTSPREWARIIQWRTGARENG